MHTLPNFQPQSPESTSEHLLSPAVASQASTSTPGASFHTQQHHNPYMTPSSSNPYHIPANYSQQTATFHSFAATPSSNQMAFSLPGAYPTQPPNTLSPLSEDEEMADMLAVESLTIQESWHSAAPVVTAPGHFPPGLVERSISYHPPPTSVIHSQVSNVPCIRREAGSSTLSREYSAKRVVVDPHGAQDSILYYRQRVLDERARASHKIREHTEQSNRVLQLEQAVSRQLREELDATRRQTEQRVHVQSQIEQERDRILQEKRRLEEELQKAQTECQKRQDTITQLKSSEGDMRLHMETFESETGSRLAALSQRVKTSTPTHSSTPQSAGPSSRGTAAPHFVAASFTGLSTSAPRPTDLSTSTPRPAEHPRIPDPTSSPHSRIPVPASSGHTRVPGPALSTAYPTTPVPIPASTAYPRTPAQHASASPYSLSSWKGAQRLDFKGKGRASDPPNFLLPISSIAVAMESHMPPFISQSHSQTHPLPRPHSSRPRYDSLPPQNPEPQLQGDSRQTRVSFDLPDSSPIPSSPTPALPPRPDPSEPVTQTVLHQTLGQFKDEMQGMIQSLLQDSFTPHAPKKRSKSKAMSRSRKRNLQHPPPPFVTPATSAPPAHHSTLPTHHPARFAPPTPPTGYYDSEDEGEVQGEDQNPIHREGRGEVQGEVQGEGQNPFCAITRDLFENKFGIKRDSDIDNYICVDTNKVQRGEIPFNRRNIIFDFNDTISSFWNQRIIDTLLDVGMEMLKHPRYYDLDPNHHSFRKAIEGKLRRLRQRWRDHRQKVKCDGMLETPQEAEKRRRKKIKDKQKRDRHYSRRRDRYWRRVRVVQNQYARERHPTSKNAWVWIEGLLQHLGEDGMSSEESGQDSEDEDGQPEDEESRPIPVEDQPIAVEWRTKRLVWRDRRIDNIMDILDRTRLKKRSGHGPQGAPPTPRRRGDLLTPMTEDRIPPGLPITIYDTQWFNGLETYYIDHELEPNLIHYPILDVTIVRRP